MPGPLCTALARCAERNAHSSSTLESPKLGERLGLARGGKPCIVLAHVLCEELSELGRMRHVADQLVKGSEALERAPPHVLVKHLRTNDERRRECILRAPLLLRAQPFGVVGGEGRGEGGGFEGGGFEGGGGDGSGGSGLGGGGGEGGGGDGGRSGSGGGKGTGGGGGDGSPREDGGADPPVRCGQRHASTMSIFK